MNKMLNILTISTYPFETPNHGGQHRLFNIVKAYQADGHKVCSIGVLGSDTYPHQEGFEFYPDNQALAKYIENPFLMEDWAIGQLYSKNDIYFERLIKHITITPDVIHIEQPWLFAFATRYVNSVLKKKIKIIYGSQNIEYKLKYDILKTYLDTETAFNGSQKVYEIELEAIHQADLVVCVSQNDLDWCQSEGAKEYLLATNGVANRKTTREGIVEANRIVGHKKFALYCASAHPPNMSGFFDYFGNGVGCIAPDEKLVIAGGAGPCILNDERYKKAAGLSRLTLTPGLVSETCLQGLLHTAHVIVLPLSHGGGTNLKTAEALWSGKWVLGTPMAFRGYEHFINSNGVKVEANPQRFLGILREILSLPPLSLTEDEKHERRDVLWESTLTSLSSWFS